MHEQDILGLRHGTENTRKSSLGLFLADKLDMDHAALDALAARARADLAAMAYPSRVWMPADDAAHNVLIADGGQSGIGLAHLLAREGVDGVSVIDADPLGLQGPWRTYARMATLRTPKDLVGIDGGLLSLSVREWYAVAFDPGAW
jgi:hypothetical protein